MERVKDPNEMASQFSAEKERMEDEMRWMMQGIELHTVTGTPVAIPIYRRVFESSAFSFRLEIFLNDVLRPLTLTRSKFFSSLSTDLLAECLV